MLDNNVDVTNYHLNVATRHGQKIAEQHKNHDRTEPVTDEELSLWEEEDIIWLVTGEKPHDVPEGYLILDAFEEGYYYSDAWEDDNE